MRQRIPPFDLLSTKLVHTVVELPIGGGTSYNLLCCFPRIAYISFTYGGTPALHQVRVWKRFDGLTSIPLYVFSGNRHLKNTWGKQEEVKMERKKMLGLCLDLSCKV